MMKGMMDWKTPMKRYFFFRAPKAPIALKPVLRPRAVSTIISAKPKVTTSTKYVIRNMPPPYFAARYGKRHMFPKPTADAAAARMNAHLPDHEERETVFSSMYPPFLIS